MFHLHSGLILTFSSGSCTSTVPALRPDPDFLVQDPAQALYLHSGLILIFWFRILNVLPALRPDPDDHVGPVAGERERVEEQEPARVPEGRDDGGAAALPERVAVRRVRHHHRAAAAAAAAVADGGGGREAGVGRPRRGCLRVVIPGRGDWRGRRKCTLFRCITKEKYEVILENYDA